MGKVALRLKKARNTTHDPRSKIMTLQQQIDVVCKIEELYWLVDTLLKKDMEAEKQLDELALVFQKIDALRVSTGCFPREKK